MPVTVAYDARGARDPRGIGRYVRCLLAALRETAAPGDEVVESSRPRRGAIFHAPWMEGASLRAGVPQVVTIHDIAALKRRSEQLRPGIRDRLRHLAVQRADVVIVPTHAVATDVEELLGVDGTRVRVIAEAPVPAMRPRPPGEIADARRRHGLPPEYLLWVGGLEHPEPRKRVAELARVPRELPLVLVGPARRWARELGDRERDVVLTGLVPDDDLAAIYSGARALVFSSDDEGFGLPTVEALACGTPVVACDVPALREVLADRATFVALDDLEALVRAAERAVRPAPAPPSFTWDDAARATWGVYRELV
jgi:glycosyltransferase involved in cell wall biosynthesis